MVSLTNFKSVSELNAQNNLSLNHKAQLCHPQQQQQQQKNPKKYHFDQAATIETKPTQQAQLNRSSTSLSYANKGEHFEIRWNNLTYEVEPKWYRQKWAALTGKVPLDSNGSRRSQKTSILSSLSGSVKSGQVTAILGPSGAGKTSLLGCLTGKNKSGVSGCVQVISNRSEPMSICTIPQKGE